MLKVLLKKQLFEVFKGYFYDAKKNKMRSKGGIAAYIVLFLVIMVGFLVMYMMFIAIMLALIANSSDTEFSYELFYALAPIFITLDFYGRFIGQQTPSQLTKPYLLLPLPRYACVESFILSSIITPNNLLWMFLTVPYAIMSIVFSYGLWTAVAFVVSFQLLVVINSQNYMFWRTLTTRSILWHIPPILIYGSLFLPWILTPALANPFGFRIHLLHGI